MSKIIVAELPTGDWCEIKDGAVIRLYRFDSINKFREFEQSGGEDWALGTCFREVLGDGLANFVEPS